MCLGPCASGPIIKTPKDGEARSWAARPSWSPHSLARCLLEGTSGDRAQQTTGAPSCPLERRGLAQAPQIRQGEVHVPLQAPVCFTQLMGRAEGETGCSQPRACVCVVPPTSSRRVLPPRLREEGLFSKVYLPTCHVLCQNHDSEGRVHLQCRPLGGVPGSSVPLGVPLRPPRKPSLSFSVARS